MNANTNKFFNFFLHKTARSSFFSCLISEIMCTEIVTSFSRKGIRNSLCQEPFSQSLGLSQVYQEVSATADDYSDSHLFFFFPFLVVLGIESKVSYKVGKCATIELYFQPLFYVLFAFYLTFVDFLHKYFNFPLLSQRIYTRHVLAYPPPTFMSSLCFVTQLVQLVLPIGLLTDCIGSVLCRFVQITTAALSSGV